MLICFKNVIESESLYCSTVHFPPSKSCWKQIQKTREKEEQKSIESNVYNTVTAQKHIIEEAITKETPLSSFFNPNLISSSLHS